MLRSLVAAPWFRSLTLAASLCAAGAAQASALILGASSFGMGGLTDVRDKLVATGQLAGAVDIFDAAAGTPTLAQLSSYDAVLVFDDGNAGSRYASQAGMGNVLADYVDAGGGVVEAAYSHFSLGLGGLGGRFVSQNYDVFANSLNQPSCGTLGTLLLPDHPLLAGVQTLSAGAAATCNRVNLKAGSTLVAHWSSGDRLLAYRTDRAGVVVGVNLYPVSSDLAEGLWDRNTDGARLFANALTFAGAAAAHQVPEPASLALVVLAAGLGWTVRRRR